MKLLAPLISLMWIPLLATAQYTWHPTSGPYEGLAEELFQASNGDLYTAALNIESEVGFVYRSRDDGATWQEVNFTLAGLNNLSFEETPDASILLGISFTQAVTDFSAIIYRSRNDGDLWIDPQFFNAHISSLTRQGNTVYAGTSDGLYYSVDNGDTWLQIGATISSIRDMHVWQDSLRLATDDGVWTFDATAGSFQRLGNEQGTITHLTSSQSGLLAASSNTELYHLSPDQATWVPQRSFDAPIREIRFDQQSNVYVATFGGLYAQDSNSIWQTALSDIPVYSLYVTENNSVLVGTTRGILRRVAESDLWQPVGVPSSFVRSLALLDDHLVAGTTLGIQYSTDKGNTWQQTNLSFDWVSSLYASDDGVLYAGLFGFRGVYESSDRGATWHSIGLEDAVNIVAIVRDATDNLIAASERSIHVRQQGEWHSITPPVEATYHSLATTSQGDIILASTAGVLSFANNTWTALALDRPVYEVAVVGSRLYAATGSALFFSDDHGLSWENMPLPHPMEIRAITSTPEGTLFIGTTFDGVYMKERNNGWVALAEGYPPALRGSNSSFPAQTYALAVDPSGTLYSGTQYHGVIRGERILSNPKEEPSDVHPRQHLAYPNPFQQDLTIEVDLDHPTFVHVTLYAILGKEVFSTEPTFTSLPQYRVHLSIPNLPPGVYVYAVRTTSKTYTGKVVHVH